ncbi:MAG: MBL fold metallo-hydrolase [Ruminococcaceae bacterium]|nr:MBL fold metallo-hydrolase [Oscillospiraceae bacterium]
MKRGDQYMSERMKIVPLEDQVWLLDDNGDATCYVVCGTEKAMVIDTVNGLENLHDIVRTITDLPLVVVNTHGHPDHIFGNAYFEEAWIHPDDAELAQFFFDMVKDKADAMGLKPCPFRWLEIGQKFDLGGGTVLEVVPLVGHTKGSIALLDRRRRVMFTGDGMNPHIWMQLDESQGISVLQASLRAILRDYGDAFDRILYGHAHDGYTDKALINKLIDGCQQLLDGKTEGDAPYQWHNEELSGISKQHHFDKDDPELVIVYRDDKINP